MDKTQFKKTYQAVLEKGKVKLIFENGIDTKVYEYMNLKTNKPVVVKHIKIYNNIEARL